MDTPTYQRNNLALILRAIGVKIMKRPGLSFPFTKEFYEKISVTNHRFIQLVTNDESKPSISAAEAVILSDHFGCDRELLTAEMVPADQLQIKIQVRELA